jgi:hypothetical protein
MDQVTTAPSSAHPGAPARLHWRSLSDGLLLSFVISGPTLFASLILHDQREHGWYAPLVLTEIGFVLGGAIAGRHRRTPRGAVYQGATVGFLTTTVIMFADVVRRLVLSKGVRLHTFEGLVAIWAVSIVVATVGALVGRWLYLRSKRRKAAGIR